MNKEGERPIGLFRKKDDYLRLLTYSNDLAEDFKKIFSPRVFNYSVIEAFLFFGGLSLAIYALVAKTIDRKSQNKFATRTVHQICDHFCHNNDPPSDDVSSMLQERQNEIIDIFSKAISKETNNEEALEELTSVIYNHCFYPDKDQYEIVYPLLFNIIREYLGKSNSLM